MPYQAYSPALAFAGRMHPQKQQTQLTALVGTGDATHLLRLLAPSKACRRYSVSLIEYRALPLRRLSRSIAALALVDLVLYLILEVSLL